MRQRVFQVPVTVVIEVTVMLTDDVDHDRETAQRFADDFGRQLRGLCRETRADPVRVGEVCVGSYPTHIRDKEGRG